MGALVHIRSAVAAPDPALPAVELRVDRRTLARRRWRACAADGTEFGLSLEAPLRPGDTVFQSGAARYVLAQEPEPVLEVDLEGLPASAVAGVSWAVGNLHLELSADASALRLPDEPAARQLLGRLGVGFRAAAAVFRPGHFRRTALSAHELGPGHRH